MYEDTEGMSESPEESCVVGAVDAFVGVEFEFAAASVFVLELGLLVFVLLPEVPAGVCDVVGLNLSDSSVVLVSLL